MKIKKLMQNKENEKENRFLFLVILFYFLHLFLVSPKGFNHLSIITQANLWA